MDEDDLQSGLLYAINRLHDDRIHVQLPVFRAYCVPGVPLWRWSGAT